MIFALGVSQVALSQTNVLPAIGNVGIGTLTPQYSLDVNGKIFVRGIGTYHYPDNADLQIGYGLASSGTNGTVSRLSMQPFGHTGGPWKFNARDDAASAYLDLNYGVQNAITIHHAGNVGIGVLIPDSKLSVNGNIRAREIKVENANWPDYVFTKDYQLPTLQQTENHIKEKGHLPGIPSAAEVKANGIDLGEMNAKLLQKIEELTLHLIEKEKEITNLKQRDQQQEDKINFILSKLNHSNSQK